MRHTTFVLGMMTLVSCLVFAGCGAKHHLPEAENTPPQDNNQSKCKGIFVLAPEEYILYIHGDDPVLLASEGRREDLAVYCTPEEARRIESQLKEQCLLIEGLWRLYRLNGRWEDDVVEAEPGLWRMRRPSELIPYPEG